MKRRRTASTDFFSPDFCILNSDSCFLSLITCFRLLARRNQTAIGFRATES
jgi:hypothetical protein